MDRIDLNWKNTLTEGMLSGALAAALSAGVVMLAGRRDSGSAVAPINAVSHWMWGDEAAQDETVNLKHTGLGALTHVLSAAFWGTLHAALRPKSPQVHSVAAAAMGGVATSAFAAAFDYGVIPKRLTPGFEKRLDTGSMVAAFAAIAIGLAVGALVAQELERD
jgi:hypothetical protein